MLPRYYTSFVRGPFYPRFIITSRLCWQSECVLERHTNGCCWCGGWCSSFRNCYGRLLGASNKNNTSHFSSLKIAECRHTNITVCTRVVFLKIFCVSCMYRVLSILFRLCILVYWKILLYLFNLFYCKMGLFCVFLMYSKIKYSEFWAFTSTVKPV